jgi:hypothetical protein
MEQKFTKNNYYNEWIGQSDGGDKLPDSVYYYVIEFNNDNETKVDGFILIEVIKSISPFFYAHYNIP